MGATEGNERLIDRLSVEVRKEAFQKRAALFFGESIQIRLAEWVRGVTKHLRADALGTECEVVHQVPHQSNEHEIHGSAEGLAHSESPSVVFCLKVREMMLATARKKRLARTC